MSLEPKHSYWFKKPHMKSPEFRRMETECKEQGLTADCAKKRSQTTHDSKTPVKPMKTSRKSRFSGQVEPKIQQSSVSEAEDNNNIDLLMRAVDRASKWLSANLKKLASKNQFYEIISEREEYSKITVRCYEHNSQIILYCATDKEALCAQCMYGKQGDEQSANRNFRRHNKHNISQIEKSMASIQHDNYTWDMMNKSRDFNLQELTKAWKKLEADLQASKMDSLKKLEKEFSKCTVELSKKYLSTKQKIEEFMLMVSSNCEGIIGSLDKLRKLSKGNRFAMPVVQHLWNVHTMRLYEEFQKEDIESVVTQVKRIVKNRLQFYFKGYISNK